MELVQDNEKLIHSFNKLANTYDEETSSFSHKIGEYIYQENLQRELPPPDNKLKLLDLGGGTGKNSLYFSKLGYSVTLLDISSESLKVAEAKFKKENLQVQIINATGEAIPMDDESVDIIVMVGCVISYTPNPKQLLKECYRVLKRGGLFYFDFENIFRFCHKIKDIELLINLIEDDENLTQMGPEDYPVRSFNPRYIEDILINDGFKIKAKYGSPNATASLPMDIRYAKSYKDDILERYKKIELKLSRDPECYGTAISCSIAATK